MKATEGHTVQKQMQASGRGSQPLSRESNQNRTEAGSTPKLHDFDSTRELRGSCPLSTTLPVPPSQSKLDHAIDPRTRTAYQPELKRGREPQREASCDASREAEHNAGDRSVRQETGLRFSRINSDSPLGSAVFDRQSQRHSAKISGIR